MTSLKAWERWLYAPLSLVVSILLMVLYWKSGSALALHGFFDKMLDRGGWTTTIAVIIGMICCALGAIGFACLLSKKFQRIIVACVLIFVGSTPFLSMIAFEAAKG